MKTISLSPAGLLMLKAVGTVIALCALYVFAVAGNALRDLRRKVRR